MLRRYVRFAEIQCTLFLRHSRLAWIVLCSMEVLLLTTDPERGNGMRQLKALCRNLREASEKVRQVGDVCEQRYHPRYIGHPWYPEAMCVCWDLYIATPVIPLQYDLQPISHCTVLQHIMKVRRFSPFSRTIPYRSQATPLLWKHMYT